MKKINLFLIFGLVTGLFLGRIHVAHGFIIDKPEAEHTSRQDLLIQRVLRDNWNIVYGFAVGCPPEKKTAAIKSAIADNILWSLQTWLEPLKEEVAAGTAIVEGFTVYHSPIMVSGVPAPRWSNASNMRYFEAAPDGFVGGGKKKVQVQTVFYYDHEVGLREVLHAVTGASEVHLRPVSDAEEWHCIPHTSYSTRNLLHEMGHAYGLPDRY